jgi:hypothetical protein
MTLVEIIEDAIVLEFDTERWLKWDDHAAFTAGLGRLPHTKAVDICADVAGEGAVFIELKDFRAAATQNAPRIRSGELAREVAEKVRDTLAGLLYVAVSAALATSPAKQLTHKSSRHRPVGVDVVAPWLALTQPR